MATDVSIAISAKDNFSTAITTMRNANQAFNKDLSGLQAKLDALNKTKVTLKVDAEKAKAALKDAEKQFSKTGDAADRLKLELANADYDNAKRNLDLVSQNAKQAEKDIISLTNAFSRSDNRAGGRSGESKGMLGTLAASGASAFLGNAVSQIANAYVGSAFGSEVGAYFGSALSGAGMGAAIGSAIAPGIGTAVGAALGGIVGIVQGAAQVFEKHDEAFKSYYKDQYDTVVQAQKDALVSGSAIAANREQKLISFSTLLGGEVAAQKYLGEMTAFAARTPFGYDSLAEISKTLLAYGYKQEELLPLLEKVGDTGSALGLSTEDMTYIATYLGRMQSTGKTTLEYLNPLLERGIPVWEYLAEASGKTKEKVQEMVSKGLVPGAEAAKAIADYMGHDFAGNMEKQSRTYLGLVSTLEDARAELENAMGEGYNKERSRGLQSEIDWISGESGAAMQEAYSQIGEWQAFLENEQERYKREALAAVMEGTVSGSFGDNAQARLSEMYERYKELSASGAEDAGAQMGALLAEAQVIAQSEYNASEGAQLELASQLSLIESIRDDTSLNTAYYDAGYKLGQEFGKGRAAAASRTSWAEIYLEATGPYIPGRAYGLSYVPYDNFPALLHEGERVLTASEARSYGSGPSVTITGNSFNIREEADIDKVASVLVSKISQAMALSAS